MSHESYVFYITIVIGFLLAEYMNMQLILFPVFETVGEPLASSVFYVSKRQLMCMFDIMERKFLLVICFYYYLYVLSKFYLLFFLS